MSLQDRLDAFKADFEGNKAPKEVVAIMRKAHGDLVQVMEDWKLAPAELHALFPAGRAASPAARAFIDYLAPQL